jgi:hypothetical protein
MARFGNFGRKDHAPQLDLLDHGELALACGFSRRD